MFYLKSTRKTLPFPCLCYNFILTGFQHGGKLIQLNFKINSIIKGQFTYKVLSAINSTWDLITLLLC